MHYSIMYPMKHLLLVFSSVLRLSPSLLHELFHVAVIFQPSSKVLQHLVFSKILLFLAIHIDLDHISLKTVDGKKAD